MIEIKNLRTEDNVGGYTRLIADISSDFIRNDDEDTIWIAVKKENENMLTTDVYNMFLFMPVYMAMYYHSELRLHGCVSKTLYKNINDYVQPILCAFSNDLQNENIIVDGFKETESEPYIVGTGASGGVDCLATLYKYNYKETDPEYKINGIFMLNCGWHGYIDDASTMDIFRERCKTAGRLSEDLHVKLYEVDTNIHAFLNNKKIDLGDKSSYFNLYTTLFGMEKAIKKYYISSSFSYGESTKYGIKALNRDYSEYGDFITLPLIHSEKMCLVSDGGQYTRSTKTEMIADWYITKHYLNVCCLKTQANNCSECNKCVRTLIPLSAMNKLKDYENLFDTEKFKKSEFKYKCQLVIYKGKDAFLTDNYNFCKKKKVKLPSKFIAEVYLFVPRVLNKLKRILQEIQKNR